MAGFKLSSSGGGLGDLSFLGKLLISGMLVGMVGAAYFVVLYSEVENDIATQKNLVITRNQSLEQAKDAKRAYNHDLAEKARREQLAIKQKKILPDSAETPEFLATLQTIATIAGIKLASWTPLGEKKEDFYAKVPMGLTLVGQYHHILKFFHGVGQADRIINIENIKMTAKTQQTQKMASAGEEVVEVKVACLATAFRALKDEETSAGRKKGGRRK